MSATNRCGSSKHTGAELASKSERKRSESKEKEESHGRSHPFLSGSMPRDLIPDLALVYAVALHTTVREVFPVDFPRVLVKGHHTISLPPIRDQILLAYTSCKLISHCVASNGSMGEIQSKWRMILDEGAKVELDESTVEYCGRPL